MLRPPTLKRASGNGRNYNCEGKIIIVNGEPAVQRIGTCVS